MKNTENKTSFVIIRVTPLEKDYLRKQAKKSLTPFSTFIRKVLGLEK